MHVLLFLLTAIVLYSLAYVAFTVNYLGVRSIVASKYTDLLFPWATSLWLDHTYWPTSKKEPTEGSLGLSPEGGMRHPSYPEPVALRPGHAPLPAVRTMVDHSGLPTPSSIEVGWWGGDMLSPHPSPAYGLF